MSELKLSTGRELSSNEKHMQDKVILPKTMAN
jgi:hypothetical protein